MTTYTNPPAQERITFAQYQNAADIISKYKEQLKNQLAEVERVESSIPYKSIGVDNTIEEINISVRLWNSLIYSKLIGRNDKIKDLGLIDISAFLQCRGVGRKVICELLEIMAMFELTPNFGSLSDAMIRKIKYGN